jgi:hypothetical protein
MAVLAGDVGICHLLRLPRQAAVASAASSISMRVFTMAIASPLTARMY